MKSHHVVIAVRIKECLAEEYVIYKYEIIKRNIQVQTDRKENRKRIIERKKIDIYTYGAYFCTTSALQNGSSVTCGWMVCKVDN